MPLIYSPRELAEVIARRGRPVPAPASLADIPLADRPAKARTVTHTPTPGHPDPAQRAWAAHVDAGRIGAGPPPRAPHPDGIPGDYGCASLAAILGIPHPAEAPR